MPTYNIADAEKEYAKLSYHALRNRLLVADYAQTIDAPYIHRAIKEREDAAKTGFLALIRDAIRRKESRRYYVSGGHLSRALLILKGGCKQYWQKIFIPAIAVVVGGLLLAYIKGCHPSVFR